MKHAHLSLLALCALLPFAAQADKDRKEEYWVGNCKVERKFEKDGDYKEKRKCKGGGPVVVQSAPVIVQRPVVVQPAPAVVVRPVVVQPAPAVVVRPVVVQPAPAVVVRPAVVVPQPGIVVQGTVRLN